MKRLLAADIPIHAMAHITGGGIPENLPRCLPEGTIARVDGTSWPRSDLYAWLQSHGEIKERDLWHTFNLGIGFCLVLPEQGIKSALNLCENQGFQAWEIGEILVETDQHNTPVLGLPA